MKRAENQAIKIAPGKCRLRIVETDTRDAIVADTGADGPTIGYIAIGAEAWGPFLAATPDLVEALQALLYACDSPELIVKGRRALAKAGVSEARL